MFANSATANTNYRQKNGTCTRFLVAKPARAFHFFVALTIASFLFWTIGPAALAQENATSTEEMINGQLPISNELPIINDSAFAEAMADKQLNATSTQETPEEMTNEQSPITNELPITNDFAFAEDMADKQTNATSTEEIVNDEQLTINDCASNATSTKEIVNDEGLTINDDASASNATSTEEIIDEETQDEEAGQIQPLIEIEFANVYYGQVSENEEAVAPQITSAIIRNVGAAPAAIMLWQDDMGLGQGFGNVWNIQYGARVSGGEWIFYDPFAMTLLPDVLMPGKSVEMEFSVKVLDFPKDEVGANTDYTGIMTINGVAAPQAEASLPLLNNILSDTPDLKPEVEEEPAIPNSGGRSLL